MLTFDRREMKISFLILMTIALVGCSRDDRLNHPAEWVGFDNHVRFGWTNQNDEVGWRFELDKRFSAGSRLKYSLYLYDGQKKTAVAMHPGTDMSSPVAADFSKHDKLNDSLKSGGFQQWLDYEIRDASGTLVRKGTVLSGPSPDYTRKLSNKPSPPDSESRAERVFHCPVTRDVSFGE
jgi:hypothetical protein